MADRALYTILGVDTWASHSDITEAYYRRAVEHYNRLGLFVDEEGHRIGSGSRGLCAALCGGGGGAKSNGEEQQQQRVGEGASGGTALPASSSSSPAAAAAVVVVADADDAAQHALQRRRQTSGDNALPQSQNQQQHQQQNENSHTADVLLDRRAEKEHFKQIQVAYDVLADPVRRRIYDTYGELGLLQLGAAPSGVSSVLQCIGVQYLMTVVILLLAAAIASILVFLAFLCAKVEDRVDWHWYSVFIPLYLVCAVCSVIALVAFIGFVGVFVDVKRVRGLPSPPIDFLKQFHDWSSTIFTMGWAAFFVLVSVGLQRVEDAPRLPNGKYDTNHVDWWLYFVPCLVSEGVLMLSTVLNIPRLQRTLLQRGIAKASSFDIRVLVLIDVFVKCCRVVGIFLVCAKVSATSGHFVDASWWVIFIPYYLTFFFMIADAVFLAQLRRFSSTAINGAIKVGIVIDLKPYMEEEEGDEDDDGEEEEAERVLVVEERNKGTGDHSPMRHGDGNGGGAGGEGSDSDTPSIVEVGSGGALLQNVLLAPDLHGSNTSLLGGGSGGAGENPSRRRRRRASSVVNGGAHRRRNTTATTVHHHHHHDHHHRHSMRNESVSSNISTSLNQLREREARDFDTQQRENKAHHPSVWSAFVTSTIFAGLPLSTLLMVAAKLEGRSISLQNCFIPLFIVLGACVIASLCVSCFLVASSHSMEDDIHTMESHARADAKRLKAMLERSEGRDAAADGHNEKGQRAIPSEKETVVVA